VSNHQTNALLENAPAFTLMGTQHVFPVTEQAWPQGTQYATEQHIPTTAFQSGFPSSTNIGLLNEIHPNDFLNGFPAIENHNVCNSPQSSTAFEHAVSPINNGYAHTGTVNADIASSVGPNTRITIASPRQRARGSLIVCPSCPESFTRQSDLVRHTATIHTSPKPCAFCGKSMAVRQDKYKEHLANFHKMKHDVAKKYSREW